jgi:hypothetical protein
LGLVLLLILLAATFSALVVPAPPAVSGDAAKRGDDQADVVLYESIVDGVRHGGNYYVVAAEQLRAGDYPMKPFVTFRLPTLAVVQAMMPGWAVIGCLYGLVAAVILARSLAPRRWCWRWSCSPAGWARSCRPSSPPFTKSGPGC